MKYIKLTALLIIITYVSIINFKSIISRINYDEQLYAIQVFQGKALVHSTVFTKNEYPDIKDNTITVENGIFKPVTYTDCRIVIEKIKVLD